MSTTAPRPSRSAGIISQADDAGRIAYRSGRTLARSILGDPRAGDDVDDAIAQLIESEFVCVYTGDDGERYLHLPNWLGHQRISHPSPSTLPPCPQSDSSGSENPPESSGSFPTDRKGRGGNGKDGIGGEGTRETRDAAPAAAVDAATASSDDSSEAGEAAVIVDEVWARATALGRMAQGRESVIAAVAEALAAGLSAVEIKRGIRLAQRDGFAVTTKTIAVGLAKAGADHSNPSTYAVPAGEYAF